MKKQNGFIKWIGRMVSVVIILIVLIIISEATSLPYFIDRIIEYTRDPWYVRAWDAMIGWF